MKFIKPLSVLLLVAPLTASAFSVKPPYTGDWTKSEYGAYTASHTDDNTIAVLFDRGNTYEAGFLVQDNTCLRQSAEIQEANPVRINGQLVKFQQICVDRGFSLYQPATKAGVEFLFSEFNGNGIITADDHRFSAKGFTEMYQLLSKGHSSSKGIYSNEQSTEVAL